VTAITNSCHQVEGEAPQGLSAESVVNALKSGDALIARRMLADFVLRNQDRIKLLARTRLAQSPRHLCDSSEVFSTALRRLDELVARGGLRPESPDHLWNSILRVVQWCAIEKVRLVNRLRRIIENDGGEVSFLLDVVSRCESDDEVSITVLELMARLDEQSQLVVRLRLQGADYRAVGQLTRIREDHARQLWHRSIARLKEICEERT